MKFNTKFLIALDSGRIVAYVPESLKPVLLDTNNQPCEDEMAQPNYAEFLELVMMCKIDRIDQIEPGLCSSLRNAEFYRKHSRTPSLVATLS